jgi:hypothetical protein
MIQIICPHCLERVDVPEGDEEPNGACPACQALLGPDALEELTSLEYDVSNPEENPHKSEGVQNYVQYLEKRARKEKKQQPYERGRFPVELVAAGVLFTLAVGLFLAAFLGSLGLAMLWKLMGGLILFMLGFLCLRFSVS